MFYNRPFSQHVSTRRPFARQFEYSLQPFIQQRGWEWQSHCRYCPDTDILELDDQYMLEIALPGVVLDDVEVKAEFNTLTVIAKRTPAMWEERANVLRRELPLGYLVRQFEFEMEIIPEQIEARMDRGLLLIAVPKVEAALRIPVSAGSIESHLPGMKTRVGSKQESLRQSKEVSIK